jgi:hypothetical protein
MLQKYVVTVETDTPVTESGKAWISILDCKDLINECEIALAAVGLPSLTVDDFKTALETICLELDDVSEEVEFEMILEYVNSREGNNKLVSWDVFKEASI